MGHAISMRATSLGASFLLLGAGVIAALTATISVQLRTDPPGPPPILSPIEEQITPPPPAHPIPPQPQRLPISTAIAPLDPVPPIAPLMPTEVLGEPASQPVEISNPFWLHQPRDLDRFYPAHAISRGIEGRATLDCQVSITGALICTIAAETPEGWGFGEAALRVAREYSMQPAMRGGVPVPGHYRMNVPFTLR